MSKFKVGDKVRVLKSDATGSVSGIRFMIGKTSEVLVVGEDCRYRLRCLTDPTDYWYFNEDELELVEGPVSDSETNPKAQIGLSNIPVELFSPIAIAYGAIGKLNGKLKYGGSNYLGTKVDMSIYLAAIQRHLDGIKCGEELDIVDNVPHFAAILANVDIILSARAAGTLVDDRLLSVGYREEMDKLKPLVKQLQELHKDKNPKHYYLSDRNG